MNNLKATFFLNAIMSIVMGVAFWFVPGTVADFLGISTAANASGLIYALLGAAFIAVAYIFTVAGFKPLLNIAVLRFAVLWSALMIIASLYSILAEYVTWGHILFVVVVNFIFFFAFIIFYPRSISQD